MAETVRGPVGVKMLLPLGTVMVWEDAKPRKDDPKRTERDPTSIVAPVSQQGRGGHMCAACSR